MEISTETPNCLSRYNSQESVFTDLKPFPVKYNKTHPQLLKKRSTIKSVAGTDGNIKKMMVSRSNSFSKDKLVPHLKCTKLSFKVPLKETKYQKIGPLKIPMGFDRSDKKILDDLNCMIPKNKLTAIR